ncbi:MAG: methylenetetrahydrofolate reductase, partial [Candidatus Omnitrophica bacterium]|nr:methylenetetrahydrofolate reductase [Candidatus Omnitrophota bacterium]
FFQTQAVYDPKVLEKFLERTRHLKARILVGIVFLKSAQMAKFMNEKVAGVSVPRELIQEIDQAKDKESGAIEIASRLIKEFRPMCQGVHIMPIGWNRLLPALLDKTGI